MDELRVSKRLKVVPVIMEDGDEEKAWKLKELDGVSRNKYLDKLKSRVKFNQGGQASITSFDGFQAELLKRTLYNELDELVSVDEIESLPASTQQALFEASQKLSQLNEDKDAEKND